MAGAVRADWHLGDLDLPDAEQALAEIAELQSAATVIDLSKSPAELSAELTALVVKEGAYAERSVDEHGKPLECALKWQPHHVLVNPDGGSLSCYGCPYHTEDPMEARSLLCALGREQEDITEALKGLAIADSLDTQLAAAFARDIEAYEEQAEAHLALA